MNSCRASRTSGRPCRKPGLIGHSNAPDSKEPSEEDLELVCWELVLTPEKLRELATPSETSEG